MALLGSYNSSIRRVIDNERKAHVLYLSMVPVVFTIVIFTVTSYFFVRQNFELLLLIFFSEILSTVLFSFFCALLNTINKYEISAGCRLLNAIGSLTVSIIVYAQEFDKVEWAVLNVINAILSASAVLLCFCFCYRPLIGKKNEDYSVKYLINNIRNNKWVTISVFSRTAFFQSDRIILNFILNPEIYGIYSICIRLISSFYLLISNLIHYYEAEFYRKAKVGFNEVIKLKDLVTSKSNKIATILIILNFSLIVFLFSLYKFNSDIFFFLGAFILNDFNYTVFVPMYIVLLFSLYPMSKFWIYLYMLNGLGLEKLRALVLMSLILISCFIVGASSSVSYYLTPFSIVISYYVACYVINRSTIYWYDNGKVKQD